MFTILSPLTNCSEQQVKNLKDNVYESTLLFILLVLKVEFNGFYMMIFF